MARAMTPQDVHAVVNLIAQEVTGQDGTITTVNSSNFVSVGETIWSYAKENVLMLSASQWEELWLHPDHSKQNCG